jgi:hypothetical protein
MHTELYSLSKIFTENLFRIPDYQRGYSWGERQLKDFWSDISLLDVNRDHYTGVLTLEDVPPETVQTWVDDIWIVSSKRYRPYYVVDGQQRLTTALVLLQSIIETIPADSELNFSSRDDIRKKYIFESKDKGISRSYIFGYEKDNPSYEHLKTRIFLERSDAHSTNEDTVYTHNLTFAKEFFLRQLKGLSFEGVETTFTKLTQHFLFNIYVISRTIDVFVAFETMNNRGKLLTHLELLKNRLIFLSTRLDVDEHERSNLRRTINEAWKTTYHYLGKNRERPLEDDSFLAIQFLLYHGARSDLAEPTDDPRFLRHIWRMQRGQDTYKDYLLESYFTSRNLACPPSEEVDDPDEKTGKPPAVVVDSRTLYEYAHDLKETVQCYYKLLNPSDCGFGNEVRIELERLGRLEWRDALPLAVAAVQKRCPPTVFLKLVQQVERFLFLREIFLGRVGPIEFDLIHHAVRIRRSEAEVGHVTDAIEKTSNVLASKLDIAELSMRWGREHGYYGWRGLKYFLFEYEQHLKAKSRSDRDKLDWHEFCRENYESDYATIEHILPQKAREEYWRARFQQFNPGQKKALRNSLGNLLAVSRAKNSSLSNRPFPDKRDGDAKSGGYRYGSYSEIEVAHESEWTADAIKQRGLRLLGFMEQRWRLSLGDDKTKLRTLGLSFLGSEENSADEFARDKDRIIDNDDDGPT